MHAHKKAVTDLAVHPSGKLALTVGRDSCLAMLNLVRGRRSFYCRLSKEATGVRFDLGGDKFFMVMEEKVSVHEAQDAKLIFDLEHQKRVLCIEPGMVSFFKLLPIQFLNWVTLITISFYLYNWVFLIVYNFISQLTLMCSVLNILEILWSIIVALLINLYM